MKKIKIFTVISFVLISVTALSACKSDDKSLSTESQKTQPVSSTVQATDYTYKPIEIISNEAETKYIHTVPPIPTEENKTEKKTATNKTANAKTDITTKNSSTGEKIEEIINDLSLITKTSPVTKGNSATVIIQGKPNARYIIEFYKNNSEKANYDGLKELTADSSGFVSWTFSIENDCEVGERKVIVKEKNSNRFIQTSITVQ